MKVAQRDKSTLAKFFVCALLSVSLMAVTSIPLLAGAPVDFEQDIRPLLAARCGQCHAEEIKSSGFSVATLDSIVRGGNKYGPSVVGGHPEKSPLIQVLRGDLTPRMPLVGKLSETEIARLEDWVRTLSPTEQAEQTDWRWPFEKPIKHTPPTVGDSSWVRNPVDAFILNKLEDEGLSPAPAASKRTLARRVYIDLVGMPPTPQEMNAFLTDESPGAYERLIDKLLADRRYGERWGRHWLDLVRYGETSGLEGDGAIGNAWRYRDWVIEALNEDMPYDKFVTLQLAGGDEHSKTRLNYVPDSQGHVPTGFLRLAPWDRSNLVAAEVRQNYLNEVANATSSVFIGLTMGCARCHDHKYDPIPTKDYYRFQAFFNAIQVEDRQSGIQRPEVPYKDEAFAQKAKSKIKEYEERIENGAEKCALEDLEESLRKKLVRVRMREAEGQELKAEDLRLEMRRKTQRIFTESEQRKHAGLLEHAQRTADPEERQALDAYEKVLLGKLAAAYKRDDIDPLERFQEVSVADVRKILRAPYAADQPFTEDDKARHAELTGKMEVLRRRLGRWKPVALTVRNAPGPPSGPAPAPTRVLTRGDYRHPGEIVKPGFPSAITGNDEPAVLVTDRYRQFPTRGLRITLAKWIASSDNPLTARVMANRIWQHHFGRGIVETPSNFGKNSTRPTHPELLDWLAETFVENGWSIKSMHRLMLLSNTYQQSSENPGHAGGNADPDNRLLWRFERRRLEAEAIRDSILWVSGRLNTEMRGPSVFPPLPDDLAGFAEMSKGKLMWEPNEKEEDARRRSIYIFQRRSLPLPMMAAFDATVFSESCERRSTTTTPLQSLSMMNGYLVHEESEHLANRIVAEVGGERSHQISQAFRTVLNRSPEPEELEKFSTYESSLASICRVLLNTNEFLYVE